MDFGKSGRSSQEGFFRVTLEEGGGVDAAEEVAEGIREGEMLGAETPGQDSQACALGYWETMRN